MALNLRIGMFGGARGRLLCFLIVLQGLPSREAGTADGAYYS